MPSLMSPIDRYFLEKDEPTRSCLQSLRQLILSQDSGITEAWQYGMPFYCVDRKRFAYLWVHKKFKQPYIGIVDGKEIDHPDLIREKRARMKILLIDAGKDLPVRKINSILKAAVALKRK